MATFAAYTRVSQVGDRGDRLLSPELQLSEIQRWADAYGHELVVLDAELNESGGREDRTIFQAAIKSVEAGEVDGIVVAALDRHEWHVTRTAEALGLADHSSLLKIMRRHGLSRGAQKDA